MKRIFCFCVATILLSIGCEGDYTIYDMHPPEIVEIEVPVEVPIEVPIPNGGGDVWIDSFEQPYSFNGVDILWVIDRSGSMNNNDAELLAGIEAMISALPPTGWRLNMVSATPANGANDAFFPLVPGDDIADALALWGSVSNGQWEQGFQTAFEYVENNSYASSWMRDDAALLVVFVSDEEEQSPVLNVSQFISWYQYLRPSVFMASIVHIPNSPLCNPGLINIGDKYIEATNYFNGVVVDICSQDWSTGVHDASAQVLPYHEWELTHLPVEDTLIVFVDFMESADWTYDPLTNTIEFTVLPPEGALVEIGYIIDYGIGDDDDSAGS